MAHIHKQLGLQFRSLDIKCFSYLILKQKIVQQHQINNKACSDVKFTIYDSEQGKLCKSYCYHDENKWLALYKMFPLFNSNVWFSCLGCYKDSSDFFYVKSFSQLSFFYRRSDFFTITNVWLHTYANVRAF